MLFLSPISLEKFVAGLLAEQGNEVMDYVHLSLLQALKRHSLATEGSPSYLGCVCVSCITEPYTDFIKKLFATCSEWVGL
jgi:hypothetical protein